MTRIATECLTFTATNSQPRHNTAPRTHVYGCNHIPSSSLLVRESQRRLRSDDEYAEPRDNHTQYSRVKTNYSNSRTRGRQACPSLYEPRSRGSSPPSHDSASDHRLARSQDERRSPCAATCTIIGIPSHPQNSGPPGQ